MLVEILKAIFFGIVQGVTEWLPISSTGHMILLNEFLRLDVSEEFWELFEVVIQLGAIFAVIVLFFDRLYPFGKAKSAAQKKSILRLWSKVAFALLPSALVGALLDDFLDEHFYNYLTVSVALIVYGVAFIIIDREENKSVTCVNAEEISFGWAFLVGSFQILALIPGTSRSGSTMLGGILFGLSRSAAAEFSFFMAIPTMAGASALKVLKFTLEGAKFTPYEALFLVVGAGVAFLVSLVCIKYLIEYVKRHSFSAFGVYRIILGAIVIGYFLLF